MTGRKTGEEMAIELSVFVNSYGPDTEGFVETVTREHRTLQQSMFGLFLACIKEWATKRESEFDLRNEFTVQMSKEFISLLEKKYGGFVKPPVI